MMPDVAEEEIRILARSMSLKFGFLGLPQGGAKAGVVGNPDAPANQRRTILYEFGRAIRPLLRQRLYIPAADMGTEVGDIRYMMQENGVSLRRRELKDVGHGIIHCAYRDDQYGFGGFASRISNPGCPHGGRGLRQGGQIIGRFAG